MPEFALPVSRQQEFKVEKYPNKEGSWSGCPNFPGASRLQGIVN